MEKSNTKPGVAATLYVDFSKCLRFQGVEDSLRFLKSIKRNASVYLANGWEYVKKLSEEERRNGEENLLVLQGLVFAEIKKKYFITNKESLANALANFKPVTVPLGKAKTSFSRKFLGAYGEYLETISNTQKVLSICEVVQNYWKSGEDRRYIEFQADKFLNILQRRFENAENKDEFLIKTFTLFELYGIQSSFWTTM